MLRATSQLTLSEVVDDETTEDVYELRLVRASLFILLFLHGELISMILSPEGYLMVT
jgi:hypothetical protein